MGGEWVEADDGGRVEVRKPATGEVVGRVAGMGAAETRRAIVASAEAFPRWRSLLARERARILRRWSDLMLDHVDDLALLLTSEQGKPLAEAEAEVVYAASFLEWFGEEAKRSHGEANPATMAATRAVGRK